MMKIETVYSLKQPLSHSEGKESNSEFLKTIRVLNGTEKTEVFAYTGNAIRGKWRDCGATHLLRTLGAKAGKKMFYVLFCGGSIAGEQKQDVEQARYIREKIPLISLLGGGLGNQILAGKISQSFALPVCKETREIIPQDNKYIDYSALSTSWKAMTNTIEFTRKDDMKDANKREEFIVNEDTEKNKDDNPVQMLYEIEYMIPGTRLYHTATIDGTDIEKGAFVSCIVEWAKNPVLGGKAAAGFGLTDMYMTADGEDYIKIIDGNLELSLLAQQQFTDYQNFIQENAEEIIKIVGGKDGK